MAMMLPEDDLQLILVPFIGAVDGHHILSSLHGFKYFFWGRHLQQVILVVLLITSVDSQKHHFLTRQLRATIPFRNIYVSSNLKGNQLHFSSDQFEVAGTVWSTSADSSKHHLHGIWTVINLRTDMNQWHRKTAGQLSGTQKMNSWGKTYRDPTPAQHCHFRRTL